VHDDLNAPLGQGQKSSRRAAFPLFLPRALAGVLALLLLGFMLWAATANDPFGGEPGALVAIEPGAAPAKPAATVAAEPVKVDVISRPADPPPGSKTVTIIDGRSGKREEVTIPPGPASPPVAPKSQARQ
jgi:outer membrane biosynthesis protein TonB